MFFGLEWLIITNILFPATVVAVGCATGKDKDFAEEDQDVSTQRRRTR